MNRFCVGFEGFCSTSFARALEDETMREDNVHIT